MFGIGGFELFLILLFGFLVFGPDKLPEIAKTVGRAIAKFRDAQAEVTSTLQTAAFDKNSDEPFKNPFEAADKVKATAKRSASTAKDVASSVKTSVQKPAPGAGETKVAEVENAQAAKAAEAVATEPARESFSERKARYERERKAKAQQAQAAEGEGAKAASANTSASSDTSAKGGA